MKPPPAPPPDFDLQDPAVQEPRLSSYCYTQGWDARGPQGGLRFAGGTWAEAIEHARGLLRRYERVVVTQSNHGGDTVRQKTLVRGEDG